MARVHEHAVRERARLLAAGLVGLVEERAHFRMLAEQDRIEVRGERFTAAFEQRHGGGDDGFLMCGQHGESFDEMATGFFIAIAVPDPRSI